MPEHFTLKQTQHAVFGDLATLSVGSQPARRFTRQEAAIVARALAAVASGASAEPQIFMSPVASDMDFTAEVRRHGVTVLCDGALETELNWGETVDLAAALDAFGATADGKAQRWPM